MFYSSGKKSVPSDLKLDPLSLSIWLMDDGSKSRSSIYFNTQQFDSLSIHNLMNSLKQLGIESTINKDKTYQRIRLRTSSISRLRELVNNFIIPSMEYKIPS